jgi:hypothetical protein
LGGQALQYRREIEGLRALAVIPVVRFQGTTSPAPVVCCAGGNLRCLAFVNALCPQHLSRESAEGFAINPRFARYAATHPGVRFFDPQEVLCGPQACDIVQNGKALYFDDTHLTPLGADRVIVRMLERIGPI